MIGDEESQAEPGDIEGGGVIARPIPATRQIPATQPRRPIVGLPAMGRIWGKIRLGRLVASWAGMRRATSLDVTAAEAQQVTLVSEDAPKFTSDRRVVAPIAEAPPHATSSPDRLERSEVFPADQLAVIQQRQQDQQIGRQMRQLAVAPLILLPTELDARIVGINVVLPFLKMRGQGDLSFDARNDCGFDQLGIAIATGFVCPLTMPSSPAKESMPALRTGTA